MSLIQWEAHAAFESVEASPFSGPFTRPLFPPSVSCVCAEVDPSPAPDRLTRRSSNLLLRT
jgi:hypothetical protein